MKRSSYVSTEGVYGDKSSYFSSIICLLKIKVDRRYICLTDFSWIFGLCARCETSRPVASAVPFWNVWRQAQTQTCGRDGSCLGGRTVDRGGFYFCRYLSVSLGIKCGLLLPTRRAAFIKGEIKAKKKKRFVCWSVFMDLFATALLFSSDFVLSWNFPSGFSSFNTLWGWIKTLYMRSFCFITFCFFVFKKNILYKS